MESKIIIYNYFLKQKLILGKKELFMTYRSGEGLGQTLCGKVKLL